MDTLEREPEEDEWVEEECSSRITSEKVNTGTQWRPTLYKALSGAPRQMFLFSSLSR